MFLIFCKNDKPINFKREINYIPESYIYSNSKKKNDLYNFNFPSKKEDKNKDFIIRKGKTYIDYCLNQKNIKSVYNKDNKFLISSIIPVYNSEKTIISSVCSIQNQNFINFEIILIDDFSTDNSFIIIQGLQEKDKRIKILKNKKNMGSLYSRSIGTLISKGKYIFALDNDDMFFSEDIFGYILNIAQKNNFDIVGFRAFRISNYNDNSDKIVDLYNYTYYQNNIIVHQPELSTWMININKKFYFHDVTIWAKCIKNNIYKEAIIKLGIKRYSKYVSWAEDTIINFVIFTISQSFIFINKYGIIHLHNFSTASYSKPINIKLFGEIFLLDIIYDFSPNNSDKNYAVHCAYFLKRNYKIYKFVNNTNLIYFKYILNKFKNSQYISIQNKKRIIKDFNSFFV